MVGTAQARLNLLGGWQLDVAGSPVAVPPAGQRLIALLALRGPMPRARAAAVLFPGHRAITAGARLRDLLSRCLRGCPGLDAVLRTDPDLALDEALRVDRWDLAAVTDELLDGHGAAPGALDDLCDALVERELLPGWDDDWVTGERERLRHSLSRALCRVSAERFRRGDLPGALIAAERARALDPLDEGAVRWQIRAHLAAGDIAPAVRSFDELQRVLRRDLGVDPEPATVELISRAR